MTMFLLGFGACAVLDVIALLVLRRKFARVLTWA
jgi:hypothetical protein